MDGLTDEQKTKLLEFASRIKDVQHESHDMNALIKWMKVGKFNTDTAEEMYRKSMVWRQEVGADTILDTYSVNPVIDKYYPGGFCGQDRQGRPVWIDPMGRGDLKGMLKAVKKKDFMTFMIHRAEVMHAKFRRMTEESGLLIDQCTNIMDMEGVGSRFMCKPAMDMYIELLKMLESNYPEGIHRAYIINAPRLFRMGWGFMTPFLNKNTVDKFKFLDGNWKNTLGDVIAPDQLPQHYGGTLCDPDGDTRCTSMICYGGEVPRELYHKKDDFYPPGVTPEVHVISRAGQYTLSVPIPDSSHAIRYVFSVDSGAVEFGIYRSREATVPEAISVVENFDSSKTDAVLAVKKYECAEVPEDETFFPEKRGQYFIHFRNTSWLSRRTISYVIEQETYKTTDGDK